MEISTETLIFLVLRNSDLDDRSSASSPEFTSEQLRCSSELLRCSSEQLPCSSDLLRWMRI